MNKFTKGKWVFNNECVITTEEGLIGNIICDNPVHSHQSTSNWRENAKLIACAPELLEALKEAIRLLYGTTEFEVIESYRKKVDNFEQVVKKATE